MPSSSLTYRALLDQIITAATATHQPVSGTFELTNRCNLSCGMCYICENAANHEAASNELAAAEWIHLAREATAHGMVLLLLTGGEVFLRPDFFDIYHPLTEMGLQITVFTNGTLITKEIAQQLAAYPPHRLEITLYGATAETYESVTGVRGSYERCCTGIDMLREAGLTSLLLKTTLTRQNVHELTAMREMAQRWDIPFTPSWLLSGRRDGDSSQIANYRLAPETSAALEAGEGVLATSPEMLEHMAFGSDEPKDELHCNAGKCCFVITAHGTMIPCMDLPALAAYPLQTGFARAWTTVQQLITTLPSSSTCHHAVCDYYDDCPWCPAKSYLEIGEYAVAVPYLCAVAKARRQQRVGYRQ